MRAMSFKATMWATMVWALAACGEGVDTDGENLCAQASAHMIECTGAADAGFDAHCQPSDALALLDPPCQVLVEASGVIGSGKADGHNLSSFSCQVLNLGCPLRSECVAPLSDEGLQSLITLSEPTSVTGHKDVRMRVNEIARIFREEGDPRGLFATVYRLITNRAVESVEDGDYAYPEWANKLITEFGRRYLANLHGHLTGGEVTGQWSKYYGLAQDCSVGRGRTLGVAIAVHLMVDLPYTLHGIGSMPEQREDFVVFGDILLEVFPDIITDIQADYHTDVTGLLNGFILGAWVDSVTSEGTMTAFIYQGVRLKAWRDGQNLRTFPRWMVAADIRTAWGLAEVALASLDAKGAL